MGNYLVFRGLTASGITLEATTVKPQGSGSPARAPINAVQLVPAAGNTIPNGLMAYWNFDGNLLDSINGFDGTSRGTNPVAFVDSKLGFGDAIKLNGSNYVDITGANQKGLDFPKGSVSIAGWFKVDAFDKDWQALISKGENSNYRIARRGGTNSIAYAGGVGEGADDEPAVNDGKWHHFVAISDATGAAFGTALYLDGVIHGINTNKPVLTANAKDLFIGENPDATGRQWKGEIDDVAIWNRVLTPTEIGTLYNGGQGTPLSALSSVSGLAEQDVNRPGDPITATSTNSPAAEGVANSQDDKSSTKYLNFDKLNTGFTVTPSEGSTVVNGIALTSANDAPERDPASYKIEGSKDGTTFAVVSQGPVPLFSGRFVRQVIHFDNTAAYTSYRVTFPTVVNAATANSMQIAEVELLGTVVAAPVAAAEGLRPDVVLQHTDGSVAFWTMRGTEIADAIVPYVLPAGLQIVGAGDFNHDGESDSDAVAREEHAGAALHEGERQEDDDERERGGEHGQRDFLGRVTRGARAGPLFLLHRAVDVFEHHDGVVDDDADGEDEAEHGGVVERVVHRAHQREGRDDGSRNGHARDDRPAPVVQEEEHGGRDEQCAEQQVKADFVQ